MTPNDVNLDTFNSLNQLFQEEKYDIFSLKLKQIKLFCLRFPVSQFPTNYDLIFLLSNCINFSSPEKVQIESLKLLEILFIQPLFIRYFHASASNSELMTNLISLFSQHINPKLDILVLRNFINFSGGSIEERDFSLTFLNFDSLLGIIENSTIDQEVKYYAARLIHNYCRFSIDLNVGIQLIINFSKILKSNPSQKIRCEINWSIKRLRPFLKIDWARTIKRSNMLNLIFDGFVTDNPDLAVSTFYIIFQLVDDQETIEFNFEYIKSLLSDMSNRSNVSIGCWGVENILKCTQEESLKAVMAQKLIDFGIFPQILIVFQNGQFECKTDAMFALCEFAKSNLTEHCDVFFQNEFISDFLGFFSSPISYELKSKMIGALNVIFEKAEKIGVLEKAKEEFVQKDGVELFEDLINDENDDVGKLANKASRFLSSYIDEDDDLFE